MTARTAELFALAAGAGDLATGLLIVALPHVALALLGIPVPSDPVYLRFVGVFVAGVGAAYLLPFQGPGGARRRIRLEAAIDTTAVVRLAVALFVAIGVVARVLAPAWLIVGFYDAVVALVQLAIFRRGRDGDAA